MKILITRPRTQADKLARLLESSGHLPVFFPVIEVKSIQPNPAFQRAISQLNSYTWVVFSSVNSVEAFFTLATGDCQLLDKDHTIKVAAIGPRTSQELMEHKVAIDFMPKEFISESILPGLGDLAGRFVLLPGSLIARDILPRMIREAGGVAHEVAVYTTLPDEPDPPSMAQLKAGVDVITFTSPSTVENFSTLCSRHGLDPLHLPGRPEVACIGPVTLQAAVEAGFRDPHMALEYTATGLAELVSSMQSSMEKFK